MSLKDVVEKAKKLIADKEAKKQRVFAGEPIVSPDHTLAMILSATGISSETEGKYSSSKTFATTDGLVIAMNNIGYDAFEVSVYPSELAYSVKLHEYRLVTDTDSRWRYGTGYLRGKVAEDFVKILVSFYEDAKHAEDKEMYAGVINMFEGE